MKDFDRRDAGATVDVGVEKHTFTDQRRRVAVLFAALSSLASRHFQWCRVISSTATVSFVEVTPTLVHDHVAPIIEVVAPSGS